MIRRESTSPPSPSPYQGRGARVDVRRSQRPSCEACSYSTHRISACRRGADGERSGEVPLEVSPWDPAFKQRRAAHGSGNTDTCERGKVRDVTNASGGLPREVRKVLHRISVEAEIGTAAGAIARDVGREHMLQALRREDVNRVPKAAHAVAGPAVGVHLRLMHVIDPNVEGETDSVCAEAFDPGRDLGTFLDRSAADDNAVDAG